MFNFFPCQFIFTMKVYGDIIDIKTVSFKHFTLPTKHLLLYSSSIPALTKQKPPTHTNKPP
ncbi:hypothetical protein, partial [Neisseria meningitidis]|uniref:hypothetical protein n=1 Tax=Neisseria meningitidis TaxID=487 RepID=UPI001C8371DC